MTNVQSPGVPRAARPSELGEVARLADRVFRAGKHVTMGDLFPILWNDDNAPNVRIVEEDGRVVSHIGLWMSEMVFEGTRIKSASMGAVCSDEAVRGKGYGTALLLDAFRHCDDEGADIVTISGGRGLYVRNECRSVGRAHSYVVAPGVAESLGEHAGGGLATRVATELDLPAMRKLYSAEAVRFSRTARDFETVFDAETCPGVNDQGQEILVVSRAGYDVAYLAAMTSATSDRVNCFEYAGERPAVMHAMGALARAHSGKRLEVSVSDWDVAMQSLLSAHGLVERRSSCVSGTQFITNPVRLFGRLERYFQERMATELASALARPEPTACGRGLTIRIHGEALELPTRSEVIDLAFGTEAMAHRISASPAAIREAVGGAFPLPFPNPCGMTYI